MRCSLPWQAAGTGPGGLSHLLGELDDLGSLQVLAEQLAAGLAQLVQLGLLGIELAAQGARQRFQLLRMRGGASGAGCRCASVQVCRCAAGVQVAPSGAAASSANLDTVLQRQRHIARRERVQKGWMSPGGIGCANRACPHAATAACVLLLPLLQEAAIGAEPQPEFDCRGARGL